jgi:glycerol-3-phosphate cytidylyltransferase
MLRKTIGLTASCFDMLHSGHITMLQEAKSVCDHLIVGLHEDPSSENLDKKKPIQTLMERQIQLNAVKYVDEIYIYRTEAELYHLIVALPINLRIIGAEYQTKKFTGYDLGIEIYYNKRDHNWSSSRLRKLVWKAGLDG